MNTGAIFGPEGETSPYRYRLWREWDPNLPKAVFIMLNPSTADATKDDPTVAKCGRYARKWGYGGYYVLNVFAFRSTDPKALYTHPDPIGPDNDKHIVEVTKTAGVVIAAWGNHAKLKGRFQAVRELLAEHNVSLHYLKMNSTGEPSHPLYLKETLTPTPWLGWRMAVCYCGAHTEQECSDKTQREAAWLAGEGS